jgi:hypothetical protein
MVRAPASKIVEGTVCSTGLWMVKYGELRRGRGNPGTERLFRVVGEKLPFSALDNVRRDLEQRDLPMQGVYVAHDSMGCPRYVGRGNIFQRLGARKKRQNAELEYFSFYVVEQKKHEREIETLLIRASGFLLEFNEKKKRVGIAPGSVKDFEAGTLFYERQYRKGPARKRLRSGRREATSRS